MLPVTYSSTAAIETSGLIHDRSIIVIVLDDCLIMPYETTVYCQLMLEQYAYQARVSRRTLVRLDWSFVETEGIRLEQCTRLEQTVKDSRK